jgi:hypothetical protein
MILEVLEISVPKLADVNMRVAEDWPRRRMQGR